MINQEMDYKIVVPGQILFFNQRWIYGESQAMNSEKIKTINTVHSWLLASFVNYGDLSVLTEWDQWWKWQMIMEYVGDPNGTVKEIQKVLQNDFISMEQAINVLLRRLTKDLGFANWEELNEEGKNKLRAFVKENDALMKEIFTTGNEEVKREVQQIYSLIM